MGSRVSSCRQAPMCSLSGGSDDYLNRVDICIVTRERLNGVRRLLGGLNELEFSKSETPDLELIVVDNSPEFAAMEWNATDFGAKWETRYNVEQRLGIPFARNTALDTCRQNSHFVVFIDDDEVPEPYWLDELLSVQQQYDADVVAGPVLPKFADGAPSWVVGGGFFERPRMRTGTPLRFAGTGNVLIRRSVLARTGIRFDDRFALSGGSDTHFFLRLHQAGCRMVWADEAVVHEWVPASRANLKWICRRAFRLGATMSRCELYTRPSARLVLVRIAKGLGQIAWGFAALPTGLVWGRKSYVRALQRVSRGVGSLSGLIGFHYQEYRMQSTTE